MNGLRKLGTILIISAIATLLCFAGCSSDSSEASSNQASSPTEPEIETFEIGETAKTDQVEFTMDEVEFTDNLGLDSTTWLKPDNNGSFVAGDGKTFIWFSFTVKNLSKTDMSGYDVCNVTAEFGDGYIYDGAVYSDCPKWSTDKAISSLNVGLQSMRPLEERKYCGFIKVVNVVREHRDTPLLLKAKLPSSEGDVDVTYTNSVPEGVVTDAEAKEISDTLNGAVKELAFAKKYAGNVNGKGSRKFADSAIDRLRNSTEGIDMNYASMNLPETAAALPSINEKITTVVDLLIDMGNTNSDENVAAIRETATEAISQIEALLGGELKAFN